MIVSKIVVNLTYFIRPLQKLKKKINWKSLQIRLKI